MTDPSSGADRPPAPSDLHTDPVRWEELVLATRPEAMLVMIATAMSRSLRQHCTPEDIWQETLAHAWRDRAAHRWQGEKAFRAWLFEVARNRIRDTARRIASEKRGGGKTERRASDLSVTFGSALHPADSISPSRVFVRGERQQAVEQALAALPPELSEVVRLHLCEELTMEEVAARLGIGLSAAWHRFRKGSELCAHSLADWGASGSGGAR